MSSITILQDELKDLGGNVQMGKIDGKTIIVIDENASLGTMSSTGKSIAIASSGGMVKLPGNLLFNLWYGRKL